MRRVGPIVLILIGCGIGLFLIEGGLRLLRPPSDRFWEPHPGFGWFHIPGKEGLYRTAEFRVPIRINSRGLRDADYPYAKAPGTYRILMLGDSMTAALEVPLGATFHKRLESSLNGGESPRRIEVIGAGVAGWGTDNEYLYFRHEGHRYQPDLVLLMFVYNDLVNNSHELEREYSESVGRGKPYFTLTAQRLELHNYPYRAPSWLAAKRWLQAHSRAFFLLEEWWDRLRERPIRGIPTYLTIYARDYSPPLQQAWAVTEALLVALQKEVEARGARFAIVAAPSRPQVETGAWSETLKRYPEMARTAWNLERPEELVGGFARSHGIPFVALLPAFRDQSRVIGRPLFFRRDGHWNADGHEVAARELERFMRQQASLFLAGSAGGGRPTWDGDDLLAAATGPATQR